MCRVSNSLLGSAGRDLPLDSACATDAAWGLVTADAGINWPHSAFVITHNNVCGAQRIAGMPET